MAIDPIGARFAQQNVVDAQARTKAALQKFEDESIRIRESSDKFYGSLALFSGGTIALSITYLGYLKSAPGRVIIHPRILIAAWIVLLVCAVACLFCPLLNSYYTHFARLRILCIVAHLPPRTQSLCPSAMSQAEISGLVAVSKCAPTRLREVAEVVLTLCGGCPRQG